MAGLDTVVNSIDAHLAVLARELRRPVLTADVEDFTRLADCLLIEVVSWHPDPG